MKRKVIMVSIIAALAAIMAMSLPIAAVVGSDPVVPAEIKADVPIGATLVVAKTVDVAALPVGTEVTPKPGECELLEITFDPPSDVKQENQLTMRFVERIRVLPEAEVCKVIECTVVFEYVDDAGNTIIIGEQDLYIHATEGFKWCIEGVNPHGKNKPGAKNEDGFYELQWPERLVEAGIVPEAMWATWRGNPDVPEQLGDDLLADIINPDVDVVIKLTEAPGAEPSIKKIGSNNGQADAVRWHITLPGDLLLIAKVVRLDGTVIIVRTACLVPPPPK